MNTDLQSKLEHEARYLQILIPELPHFKHLAGFTSSPSPNGEKKAATL